MNGLSRWSFATSHRASGSARAVWAPLLVAFAVLALLAGCGGDDEGAEPVSAGNDGDEVADDAEFDTSRTLRLASTTIGPTLDPHAASRHALLTPQLTPFWDTLVVMNQDYEVQPWLATEWTIADDGLSITLTLRDDVEFHDGTPLTADAVVASLDRARQPDSAVAPLAAAIGGVTAVDDHTVEIALTEPDAALLPNLALNLGMVINPNFIDDADAIASGELGVASGAYTVDNWVPTETVTFTKNEDYWNDDVVAMAPGTVIHDFLADGQSRLNALRTGEYDAVHSGGIPADLERLAESDDGVVYEPFNVPQNIGFLLRLDQAPFDDVRVRQALGHAVDFRSMLDSELLDADCDPSGQIWPEGHWAHNPEVDFYEYDPDRARELLTEAGFEDGFTMTLIASPGTSTERAGTAIQSALGEVGITVEIQPLPVPEAVPAFERGDFQALLHSISSQADPATQVADQVIPLADRGDQGPAIQALAQEARDGTLSRDERGERYREITQIIHDEALFHPFCAARSMYAHTADLVGAEDQWLAGLGQLDPRFVGFVR